MDPSSECSVINTHGKECFDPFQVFEVEQKPCYKLTVTILRGRNVVKAAKNLVDTPDPYVKVSLSSTLSPNVKFSSKTDTKDNEGNPEWNHTFSFIVDLQKTNVLNIELFDEDLGRDKIIGIGVLDLNKLIKGKKTSKTFKLESFGGRIKNPAEVDAELLIEEDHNPDLRFSMCLCDDEKEFLAKRQQHVFKSMKEAFADKAPKSMKDMPGTAVVHSGGGYRAVLAAAGVFKGLHGAGLLDLVSYMSGLSGSTWYMSHLYTNPDWPDGLTDSLTKNLKPEVTSSFPNRLLRPDNFFKSINALRKKKRSGQEVSFTDFFGYILGKVLQPSKFDAKLSDEAALLKTGKVPMHIYTACTVKPDVMASEFHEWVECTAFEVAQVKYGIAMKTEHFGSKFFMGRLVKQYPEPPLHFFQAIWGSVWAINLQTVVKQLRKYNVCCFGNKDVDDSEPANGYADRLIIAQKIREDLHERHNLIPAEEHVVTLDAKSDDSKDVGDENDGVPAWYQKVHDSAKQNALNKQMEQEEIKRERKNKVSPQTHEGQKDDEDPETMNWLDEITQLLSEKTPYIGGKAGRIASIFNYLKGLELKKAYPLSPFSHFSSKNTEKSEFPLMDTEAEHNFIVDAGIACSLPFTPLLRPQRNIDVFLSFGYTLRDTDYDKETVFEALKTAEAWAKVNYVTFPKIDESVYKEEGMKEVYVFQDLDDPLCPIILHFPLVNLSFKDFKAPGVPRETEEEKEYGNFNVYEDGEYGTMRLTYDEQDFDRMVDLMTYNVLNNSNIIKEAILRKIQMKGRQIKTKMDMYEKAIGNMAEDECFQQRLQKTLKLDSTEKKAMVDEFMSRLQDNEN